MKIKGKDLYWLKSAFFTIMQNLSGVIFSFGGFYFLIRQLDKHHFGAWGLFLSTTTILEFVRSGLIQNALITFLASSKKEEHAKIISSSFTISAIMTLICVILNLCFAHYLARIWDSPELLPMFYLYSVAFIISGLATQFNCVLQANLKFNILFVNSFITQAVYFTYIAVCYFLNFKIELIYLVYVQIINFCISAMISYSYAKPYIFFHFKLYPEWIKKLFDYGKYAFGTNVSSILSSTLDQWMLGAILSPVASGAFNVAVRITNLIDVPTNALAVIVFPKSARSMATEGKAGVKYLYEKSVGTLMAILVPMVFGLYLFSGFVVKFIATQQYQETIPLLHITLLYCLLIPYGRQFGNVLDSIGKTRLTFTVVVFSACLNIGLNYLFISKLGVIGAAYATLTSNVIGFIIGQTILRKELDINLLNTLKYAFDFYPEFYRKYITPLKNRQETISQG